MWWHFQSISQQSNQIREKCIGLVIFSIQSCKKCKTRFLNLISPLYWIDTKLNKIKQIQFSSKLMRNDFHILMHSRGHEFLLSADLVMLLFFKQVSGPSHGQGQRCVNNKGRHSSKTNAHFTARYCYGVHGVESDFLLLDNKYLNSMNCSIISRITSKSQSLV